MTDWILRGGEVVDGGGGPRRRADVAIAGDRIAAVGEVANAEGAREIDVSGRIVAPGFIDVHTHDDRALFATPEMAAKASQGVTTVITGNCGISLAPLVLRDAPPPPLDLIGARPITATSALPITWRHSTGRRRRSTPHVSSAIRPCGSARWRRSTGRPIRPSWSGWASGCGKRSTPVRSACRAVSRTPRPPPRPPPRSRRWRHGCGRPGRSTRRICATRPTPCSTASTRASPPGARPGFRS